VFWCLPGHSSIIVIGGSSMALSILLIGSRKFPALLNFSLNDSFLLLVPLLLLLLLLLIGYLPYHYLLVAYCLSFVAISLLFVAHCCLCQCTAPAVCSSSSVVSNRRDAVQSLMLLLLLLWMHSKLNDYWGDMGQGGGM
jgi:hypothetical protein